MITFFNPHKVLELIQLSQDELEWFLGQAGQGKAWSKVEVCTPTELYKFIAPIWLRGPGLWKSSGDVLRDEHLHPDIPFWEFLLLGWAQVRLRGHREEMNRRDIAWAAVVKACIVGFYPDFPGSADLAYRHGRDKVFQLAEALQIAPIPKGLSDKDSLEANQDFTVLAFGMLLDMLLDPDKDMLLGRVTRAMGLLDRAKQFVKSEDVAQARKLLAEIADVKALSTGARLTMKKTVDWPSFKEACNKRFEERQSKGEDIKPALVAAELGVDVELLHELVAGQLDGHLSEDEIRILAFMVSRVIDVPLVRYLK